MTKNDFASAMYDVLCEEYDKFFRRFDSCDFDEQGECMFARYLNKVDPNCCDHQEGFMSCCDYHMGSNPSSAKCEYLTPTGCSTKCLACKSFACPRLQDKLDDNEVFYLEYWKLRDLSYKLNIYTNWPGGRSPVKNDYYLPKEVWLEHIN